MINAARQLVARYAHINWALADQTMISLVNFVTGILLARYLGFEEFGRFTLAWMVVLVVVSIQHAVINSPMISIGPKQPEEKIPAYYGAVMIHQLVFACLAALLVFAGAHVAASLFPDWRMDDLALPLASATLMVQCQDFLRRYFFTRNRGKAAVFNDAVRYLGQLAILIWLFRTVEMSTALALWVIAAVATSANLTGLIQLERTNWDADIFRETTHRHWKFSKWLLGSAVMQFTSSNLYFVVTGSVLGAAAVGALRAAQNLMGIVHIFFMGLENVVPARAAREFQRNGTRGLTAYTRSVVVWGGAATSLIAAIAAIAPSFWLKLVYGDVYSQYGDLLQWFALAYIFIFLSLPIRAGVHALEQTKGIFGSQLLMAVFNVLSIYPLVLNFGMTGVCVGIVAGNVILIASLTYVFRRNLRHAVGSD